MHNPRLTSGSQALLELQQPAPDAALLVIRHRAIGKPVDKVEVMAYTQQERRAPIG